MTASRRINRLGAALLGSAALTVALPMAGAFAQAVYETPEAASDAMLAVIAAGDIDGLFAILGEQYRDALVQDDPQALQGNLADIAETAKGGVEVEVDGDVATVVLGQRDWPLPVPIAKVSAGWSFDMEAGLEEILARRVGANELEAIAVCQAYLSAQEEYASKDRDGDGVLEFAQRIFSTPGQKDGLYWKEGTGGDNELSPFGPFIAEEATYLEGKTVGDSYHGYFFRILSRQNENVPGGRYDYVINGNMIAGYGLVGYPAEYGETGIMTFQCSHHGRIWQRDLGEATDLAAAAIQEFVLGDGWAEVDDETLTAAASN